MVNDVESILNEIKERVREENASAPGRDESPPQPLAAVEVKPELDRNESLARASAHLTTTARAWDRLPPVFSNRRGAAARIELWVKARFKSWARWFTWEQVNFNAATHHALAELVAALSAHQHELLALRREHASQRLRQEEIDGQIQSLRANIEAHTAALRKDLEEKIGLTLKQLNEANAAMEKLSAMMTELATEMRAGHSELANTRLPELVNEIDRRLAEIRSDLTEQQRVCFKQLMLETSEAAILEDRGRRALEARLEKLESGRRS